MKTGRCQALPDPDYCPRREELAALLRLIADGVREPIARARAALATG